MSYGTCLEISRPEFGSDSAMYYNICVTLAKCSSSLFFCFSIPFKLRGWSRQMLGALPSIYNFLAFYVIRKDLTLIFIPFLQVFGVFPFLPRLCHQGDILLQLYWLPVLASAIDLHGKDRALTMTRTAAFPLEAAGYDVFSVLHII